ncbi:hypothetical protein [Conexibacter arvalis]|uniref:Carboxypeptidase regulatory-like domain-containing protein n=1 Tax=Conexibacter arvalis TaxID=912552 RepID=A0A840IC68_9ACTN|nr:hypothetical protein [Conexibacter arvalis]MBB4662527.1 hypothetical protein [Conexibacter arvalis]
MSVDGEEVRREVVDSNGGACRDVEPGNDDPYEFAAPQPCPVSASGSFGFDTRGLRDGEHRLKVEVEDVAGNVALLHEGPFTSHNGPIATAVPQVGGEARVGRMLTATTGAWDGAPTAVSVRWLRCDAGGEACAAIAGAGGTVYTLTSADVGHRVVAEAVAENPNGSGSGRSTPTAVVVAEEEPPGPKPGDGRQGGDPTPTPPAGGPSAGGPSPGGVDGLRNPIAEQGGHAPNGDGASAQARVTLRVRLAGGGTATRARGRHARRWTITGRVTDAAGRGIADARLNLVARILNRRWKASGLVRTGDDGRFSHTLKAGPSRQVRVTYYPFADSRAFRASNVVLIESLAPLTVRVNRTRVAGGGTVSIAGRVAGAPIPRGGLLVTLQGHQKGWGWRTFRTVRTTRSGRWKTRYSFRSRSGRFAFRAIVPRQAGYPFASTTSTAVTVRVG